MTRTMRTSILTAVLALLLAAVVTACGSDEGTAADPTTAAAPTEATTADEPATPTTEQPQTEASDPTSTEQPTESSAAAEELPAAIYLVKGEKVSPVRRHVNREAPAGAALEALLAGPTAEDEGRLTEIPEGTRLLGVSIDDAGVLTADLSEEFGSGGGTLSMRVRLAQVVFTATQFPTVKGVLFAIEGNPITTLGGEGIVIDRPQTRADYEDETPLILVEDPLPHDVVSCPVPAHGSSNVFEASSLMGVTTTEDELPPDPTIVTATSGTGTRGTFEVEVACTPPEGGFGYLVSWLESAKDGSPQQVERIPLEFR
jgi:spore germination protein GerM